MENSKILIVEDEVLLAEDISENLTEMGFNVVGIAHTGKSAINIAREKNPDLVLMDIQLRGSMDGLEAANHISLDPGCAIVFLTAYAEDSILEEATKSEPFGYLVKPVNLRELRATIQMALYKVKMEAERKKLMRELQEALDEIITLREFLPICAWCKKVRDDKGYWERVEDYISKQTGSKITHGICPSCSREMLKEIPGS